MLLRPSRIVNPVLLAVDPSSTTIGYSVLEFDMDYSIFNILEAGSFCAAIPKSNAYLNEICDARHRRFIIIKEFISRKLSEYSFSDVYCEDTYLKNGMSDAYASLLGCIQAVKDAVIDCSYTLPITLIPASSVKSGLGVKGDSGDKLLMLKALQDREHFIKPPNEGFILGLDQHAIDAICIGTYGGMISYGVIKHGSAKKKQRK